MIPASFDYSCPKTLAEAIALLKQHGPDAKILAGGQSPAWETDKTCTPSPHHPIGAKGVGESPTMGAPAAIANAVVDALWHLGVRHIDIPITPPKLWKILMEKGVAE